MELYKKADVLINNAEAMFKSPEKNQLYQLAIENLSKILKSNPNFYRAYYDRAYCKKQLGLTMEAIKDFKFLEKVNYENKSKLYQNLGNCYMDIKKYDDAIKCFTIAISHDSLNFITYANRGFSKLYKLQPDSIGACDDYKKAIELGDTWDEKWVMKTCK